MITLDKIDVGETVIVNGIIESNKKVKRHLLEMGLIKGTKILVKKKSPNNQLLTIYLRDYNLTLSMEDLRRIKVEKIN
ncbi:MAG: FeoA family protein [bacterium]|nr:FeoA family protein [bacterium]